MLTYMVDAESLGVDNPYGDNLKEIRKDISKKLSDEAKKKEGEGKSLRLAILDRTKSGNLINGRDGADYIDGGFGDDKIFSKGGDDRVFAGIGNDTVDAGSGNNTVAGGLGNDTITTGDGNDVVVGGQGNDTIKVGPGNDMIIGLSGKDFIDGGADTDTVKAERLFASRPYYAFTPGKAASKDQAVRESLSRKNWQQYNAPAEPKIGYEIDLNTNSAVARVTLQAISDLPSGVYNTKYNTPSDPLDFFRPRHREDFKQFHLIPTNEKLAPLSLYGHIPNEQWHIYHYSGSRLYYLEYTNGASSLQCRYNNYVTQAKNAGRKVYILGKADISFNIPNARHTLFVCYVLSDGQTILFFDHYDSCFKVTAKDLLAMTNNNLQSAAGFYLYCLEKLGVKGTIKNVENLIGSSQNDLLKGDKKNNTLIAGDGDDQLYGQSGNDVLDGSGKGNNVLDGGAGNDTASYRAHKRGIQANLAEGSVNKGTGTDRLQNIENISGTDHADTITGDDKANILVGGKGNDTLKGGKGADVLYGGSGADHLNGGDGHDIASYADQKDTGINVDMLTQSQSNFQASAHQDKFTSIEGVIGSQSHDNIKGDAADNRLDGGKGNDVLEGRSGNDALYGGEGDDTLRGGEGMDNLFGGAGADRLQGGSGSDYYRISKGHGRDIISDSSGNADIIEYEKGIELGNLIFHRNGNNLVIYCYSEKDTAKVGNLADRVTVENYFTTAGRIEVIMLSSALIIYQAMDNLIADTNKFISANGGDLYAISISAKQTQLKGLTQAYGATLQKYVNLRN